MPARRYTDEQLIAAQAASRSMADLCRRIGVSSGGRSSASVVARLRALGFDPPPPRPHARYDPAVLVEAAAHSLSVAEVVRRIGARQTGGTQAHIGRRLRQLGIDITHLTGQAHARGRSSPQRLTPERLLVLLPPGSGRPDSC